MSLFFPNNKTALEIVNKYKNIIYSYLEAAPSTGQYKKLNSITTIPVSDRNENNGYANFLFSYNEPIAPGFNQYNKCYVRVETGGFDGRFSIKATKVTMIRKADLIIFTCPSNPNTLYIADRKLNNDNKWLLDKSLRNATRDYFSNGHEATFYHYDIETLWRLGHIIEIYQDEAFKHDGMIAILHNDYTNKSGDITRTCKTYNDYDIDTSHIKFVQYDARTAYSCFFGFKNNRFTSNDGTIPGIIRGFSDYIDEDLKNVYHRMYTALDKTRKTEKACSCKIKLSHVDCMIDPAILNENNELEIFLSDSPDFDIEANKKINKTSDMKSYQKTYQKVVMYLKRHTNAYNPKWTEEEKAIADKYLTKGRNDVC